MGLLLEYIFFCGPVLPVTSQLRGTTSYELNQINSTQTFLGRGLGQHPKEIAALLHFYFLDSNSLILILYSTIIICNHSIIFFVSPFFVSSLMALLKNTFLKMIEMPKSYKKKKKRNGLTEAFLACSAKPITGTWREERPRTPVGFMCTIMQISAAPCMTVFELQSIKRCPYKEN